MKIREYSEKIWGPPTTLFRALGAPRSSDPIPGNFPKFWPNFQVRFEISKIGRTRVVQATGAHETDLARCQN